MNKKDLVLKILDVVKDTRDMAPGLKLLVENNALDDSVIDTLVSVFRQAAGQTEDIQTKQALEKSADMIQDIHTKEAIEQEKDLEDIKELEQLFKDI